MESEELSKKLEQYEQNRASLRSQMDQLYCEFQDAMPEAAASWIDKEVKNRIRQNPDIIQSLGVEKLRELKAKLKTLIERLAEIVTAEFQDRSKWPHHIEKEVSYLNKVFRNVISNLGDLLNEFGLLNEPEGYVPSWERIGQDSFRYRINPGKIGLPESKMAEYNELFKEYTSLSEKIKDTRRLLSEAKANELWEQA